MDSLEILAPFVGAVALEAVHWYELREKLSLAKYRRLLRSTGYWIATVFMALVGSLAALILFQDEKAPQLLVAGAAMPALLKKLVGSALSSEETELGARAEPGSAVRDYFSVS